MIVPRRLRWSPVFVLPLALLGLAPTCAPGGATAAEPLRTGTWGGEHVRLDATSTGATLEFDCGHGATDSAIVLDDDGRFAVEGTFVPEGGPTPVPAPSPLRARYSGRVTGEEMRLEVRVVQEGDAPPEAYVLRFGDAPRLTKCY